MRTFHAAATLGALMAVVLPLNNAHARTTVATDEKRPSVAATNVLLDTALTYETTVKKADDYRARAKSAKAQAVKEREAAAKLSSQVVDYVVSAGALRETSDLAAASQSPEQLMGAVVAHEQVKDANEARLVLARKHAQAARANEKRAKSYAAAATKMGTQAVGLLQQLNTQAKGAGQRASSSATEGLPATHAEQLDWNRAAAKRWNKLASRLEDLPTVTAEELNTTELPKRVHAKRDADGTPIPGVAQSTVEGHPVLVLPEETIALVQGAFNRLGGNFTIDTDRSTSAWSCGSLIENIDGAYPLGGTPADLYATTQPVPPETRQIGDLVFLASLGAGVHHVGVYIGNGEMIDASALRYQVGVTKVPRHVFAVTRPALGPRQTPDHEYDVKNPDKVCAADFPHYKPGWKMPMRRGTYTLTARFGESGPHWRSGHTGQDFASKTGTPVRAARTGVVSLSKPAWAGTLITVKVRKGSADAYAHTSEQLVEDGETVHAGQMIARVGSEGNATGPHLHFEILEHGKPVDPLPSLLKYLPQVASEDSWGGYGNGRIPESVLCPVTGNVYLRCDVAADFNGLAATFKAKFGHQPSVVSGYESLLEQIQTDKEGSLKNLPGTSPNGWGTRVSLRPANHEQKDWIEENAHAHHFDQVGNILATDRR